MGAKLWPKLNLGSTVFPLSHIPRAHEVQLEIRLLSKSAMLYECSVAFLWLVLLPVWLSCSLY